MIKALLLFVVPAVLAHGGHGLGAGGVGVAASPYVYGYARPYTSGYTSRSYVTARPQLYATTYPQFAEVGVAPAPALPALPALPAKGHKKHGAVTAAQYIVAAPRTYIQPEMYTVAKRVVSAPLAYEAPLYESETVQERVFREPISKTVTELPDEVRRVKKVINQHFPMVHQQVTDHYTVEDVFENNIIHHYYEPEQRYLGMQQGEKIVNGVQHVDHPGETYQEQEDIIEEMVIDAPSYKTVMTEEPWQRMETYQVPSVKTVVTDVPRVKEFVTEEVAMKRAATPVIRSATSRKAIQRKYSKPAVPTYTTGELFPEAVRQAIRSGY